MSMDEPGTVKVEDEAIEVASTPDAANDDGHDAPDTIDAADTNEVEAADDVVANDLDEGDELPDEDEDAPIDEGELQVVDEDDGAGDYELDVEHVRMAEALLFAAAEPLNIATLKDRMPQGVHIPTVLEAVKGQYEGRGVHLTCVAGKWAFRTSPDLSFMMEKERVEQRRLSRAAIETLAIIAYHQPVTRAEIEAIRGVSVSKGTVDVLMEIGWVKLRGRRRVPGRPVTYGTTEDFLDHFGLEMVKDLPGLEELKAAGLLDARLPAGFAVPLPEDTLPEEDDDDEDEQEDLFGGDIATPFDDEADQLLEE